MMQALLRWSCNVKMHRAGTNMSESVKPSSSIDSPVLATKTDHEGFLLDLSEWNESVADQIAALEDIKLTDSHWEIIRLLREFYAEYQVSPAMRIFVKQVKNQLGTEKGNSLYLLSLFPESPAKLASKIAGLPKPTNCL